MFCPWVPQDGRILSAHLSRNPAPMAIRFLEEHPEYSRALGFGGRPCFLAS